MWFTKIEFPVQKIKSKKEEKNQNDNALGAYNKQYKQRFCKCGKYIHEPGNWKCPENKNENEEKNKKTEKDEEK